jgi:hypothetical protein
MSSILRLQSRPLPIKNGVVLTDMISLESSFRRNLYSVCGESIDILVFFEQELTIEIQFLNLETENPRKSKLSRSVMYQRMSPFSPFFV